MKSSNKKIIILVILVAVIACVSMVLLKPDKTSTENATNITQNDAKNAQGSSDITNPEPPISEEIKEEDPTKNDENINVAISFFYS